MKQQGVLIASYLIFNKASLECCPGLVRNVPCGGGAAKVAKFDLSSWADEKIFNLQTNYYTVLAYKTHYV